MKKLIFILCVLFANQFTYADDYSDSIIDDTESYLIHQLGRDLSEEEKQIVSNFPEVIHKVQQTLDRELSREQYLDMRAEVLSAILRMEEKKAQDVYAQEQLKKENSRPQINNDFGSLKTKAYRDRVENNYFALMICVMGTAGLEASTEKKSAGFSAGGGVCINLLELDVYSIIFVSPTKAINAQLAGSISALFAVSDSPQFSGRYEGIRAGFSFKLGAEGGYYSNQEAYLGFFGVRGGWGFMLNDSPIELHRIAGF